MKLDSALKLARFCRDFALDKKAVNPVILDVRKVSSLADYFVICSAHSEPQIKAIANGLEKELKEQGSRRPLARDGYSGSQWAVVDYGDVMVHIFHENRRGYYDLERLWGDAKRVK